ncbi:hypothetical protein [Staphylothermus hellenicus]|uniref:Uncharacterized protein n=1 Tax=Staphylothermus hellenicus (strain DSM 12710 / JCM 10830 / BK20S6-10-b1 / P8) TaxID=591019 RepID=D7D9G8_STAHD|nr:hypothetical protein [Staphylothermus hellenicus]ADI32414.1 hypothetical protein Shell_1322 [Staphylothermus hellenicus DSM 12710]
MYTWIDVDHYNSNYMLTNYDPTTTLKASTVTITVFPPVLSMENQLPYSWSYPASNVHIIDLSDYSLNLAKWWHNIAEDTDLGSTVYRIEPGALIRVPQDSPIDWQEHYGVKYGRQTSLWWFPWWHYWEYTGEGWIEVKV